MNVRSCQLCGKPLSRLRVGGDGDFCSREHRSQHRLRRGMDRLEEANKVTSLMRRRENPRQISAARLMCNSALERRGFFEPRQALPKIDSVGFAPVLPGPAAPRVAPGPDRYAPPRPARLSGDDAWRGADASRIQIDGRGTPPAVPPRQQKFPARITRASLVSLRCDTPAPAPVRRDFGMLRRRGTRIYLDEASLAAGALQPRRAPALVRRSDLRSIGACALEGNALRVSIGMGFRAPAVNWRDYFHRPMAPVGLVWSRTPRRLVSERQDAPAACRSLNIDIPMFHVRLPGVPNGARVTQIVFPGTLAPRNRWPATGTRPAKRTTDVSWRLAEPRSTSMAVVPPAAGFASRNGAHLFTLVMTPTSTRPAQQVAFTAFVPQEPVGLPRVAFVGTTAVAIAGSTVSGSAGADAASEPPAAPARPAEMVRIEEHFGSGWDNWQGGMKEWLVDVAGVRTGPLALFVPSLELIDYEVEFLARIDTRSLNWAVRAAGLDEYVRCTLTAVPGGEVEFSRSAVVGGVAQAPITTELRLPGKPRAAMTVSAKATGDSFMVAVDGKEIAAWDDDRFPMGGVGFIGAPDDRARLYWVRLSSTELTAKEHQNK